MEMMVTSSSTSGFTYHHPTPSTGSFSIEELQVHDSIAGVNKAVISPKMIAYGLRACFEPIIQDHFGSSGELMDEFINNREVHQSSSLTK
jgi:hypothetical protein